MTDTAAHGLTPPSYSLRLLVGRTVDSLLILAQTGEHALNGEPLIRQSASSLRPGAHASRERLDLMRWGEALAGNASYSNLDSLVEGLTAVAEGDRDPGRITALADAMQSIHTEIARDHAIDKGPPDIATRGW